MKLTTAEKKIERKILDLKNASGSHSPSIITLAQKIPEIKIKVDACFLSNPYATDIFLDSFEKELVKTGKLRDFLEFYPSQNTIIAECLSQTIGIPSKNIIIGNGGIELIEAVLHTFAKKKIMVNLPTFSPYYEFARDGAKVIFHYLKEEHNFKLQVDAYLADVYKNKPDTVVIINPNNPDGSYLNYAEMLTLLKGLKDVETVIVDESFIHFAFEDTNFELHSIAGLIKKYPNLVVVKSMSKDFGIAGIRAGYGVMSADRVKGLLDKGFLWNSNGLAEYFFRLYGRADFWKKYDKARIRYIRETHMFFKKLKNIPQIQVVPGMTNFALVKLLDGTTAQDLALVLLVRYGIHVRDCADKIGLHGEYIRIASRKKEENEYIVSALNDLFAHHDKRGK